MIELPNSERIKSSSCLGKSFQARAWFHNFKAPVMPHIEVPEGKGNTKYMFFHFFSIL